MDHAQHERSADTRQTPCHRQQPPIVPCAIDNKQSTDQRVYSVNSMSTERQPMSDDDRRFKRGHDNTLVQYNGWTQPSWAVRPATIVASVFWQRCTTARNQSFHCHTRLFHAFMYNSPTIQFDCYSSITFRFLFDCHIIIVRSWYSKLINIQSLSVHTSWDYTYRTTKFLRDIYPHWQNHYLSSVIRLSYRRRPESSYLRETWRKLHVIPAFNRDDQRASVVCVLRYRACDMSDKMIHLFFNSTT